MFIVVFPGQSVYTVADHVSCMLLMTVLATSFATVALDFFLYKSASKLCTHCAKLSFLCISSIVKKLYQFLSIHQNDDNDDALCVAYWAVMNVVVCGWNDPKRATPNEIWILSRAHLHSIQYIPLTCIANITKFSNDRGKYSTKCTKEKVNTLVNGRRER